MDLKSSERGISETNAEKRLAYYGPNKITTSRPRNQLKIFGSQFTSPLVIVLLVAGTITLLLQDYHDAIFILFTAFFNAVLGFYQENKAERALEHLGSYITSRVRVTRDGADREIDTLELVPGDIIHLVQGARVPADVRIIKSSELRIDQAVLTGESLTVEKDAPGVAENALLADRKCIAYAGTMVTQGIGIAVVVTTDDGTEFGAIARAVTSRSFEQTPLQKALREFTSLAAGAIILLSIVLFMIASIAGLPLLEAFLISLAILVAAVPEGLPIVTTVILAIGVQRLAKRKGIVRRLTAAETLGSTSIILTDKTGTLTQAKMSLAAISVFAAPKALLQTEINNPNFAQNESELVKTEEEFLLHAALLNIDAIVENPKDHHTDWRLVGKPLEVALIKAAAARGVHFPSFREGKEQIRILPFNSLNKFSASLYKMPLEWFKGKFKAQEPFVLSLLGAPDVLLNLSNVSDLERERISRAIGEMGSAGQRLVGVAIKEVENPEQIVLHDHKHLAGLRFLGILSFEDPLRPGISVAIEHIQESGVRVIIVTGDQPETAAAIARKVGIEVGSDGLLHGAVLDSMTDEQVLDVLPHIKVIARVSPTGKLRIVKLLQQQGEIVAMTGDGINDAPALRQADIGVAMGTGTDVSQDVSDLILLDDNFETIAGAIFEGRQILSNMRKAIVYLTSTLMHEIVLIGGSLLLGIGAPLNALQILWINFLTDSFPGIALAFEKDVDGARHRIQHVSRGVFTGEMKYLIVVNGLIGSILLFLMYQIFLSMGFDAGIVKTFIYGCLGTYSLFAVLSIRNLKASIFSYNPFANRYLTISILIGFILTIAAIYVPFLQHYFGTVTLPAEWLIGIFLFGMFNILLIELAKLIFEKENI